MLGVTRWLPEMVSLQICDGKYMGNIQDACQSQDVWKSSLLQGSYMGGEC